MRMRTKFNWWSLLEDPLAHLPQVRSQALPKILILHLTTVRVDRLHIARGAVSR